MSADGTEVKPKIGRPISNPPDLIIQKVLEFIGTHLDRKLSLRELCEAAGGVKERTLRQIFEERFGIGPARCAHLVRMKRIREALLAADPVVDSVVKIAGRFGMTELGNFSNQYRKVFNERPSVTLQIEPKRLD